jgi:hypothetical protein
LAIPEYIQIFSPIFLLENLYPTILSEMRLPCTRWQPIEA